MTTTNDNPIEKLDAVIGAMTPGPWVDNGNGMVVAHEANTDAMVVHGYVCDTPYTISSDARGIATLRNVAPELLAVVRAMRAIRDGDWWEVRHKDVQRGADALDALYAKIREAL